MRTPGEAHPGIWSQMKRIISESCDLQSMYWSFVFQVKGLSVSDAVEVLELATFEASEALDKRGSRATETEWVWFSILYDAHAALEELAREVFEAPPLCLTSKPFSVLMCDARDRGLLPTLKMIEAGERRPGMIYRLERAVACNIHKHTSEMEH